MAAAAGMAVAVVRGLSIAAALMFLRKKALPSRLVLGGLGTIVGMRTPPMVVNPFLACCRLLAVAAVAVLTSQAAATLEDAVAVAVVSVVAGAARLWCHRRVTLVLVALVLLRMVTQAAAVGVLVVLALLVKNMFKEPVGPVLRHPSAMERMSPTQRAALVESEAQVVLPHRPPLTRVMAVRVLTDPLLRMAAQAAAAL